MVLNFSDKLILIQECNISPYNASLYYELKYNEIINILEENRQDILILKNEEIYKAKLNKFPYLQFKNCSIFDFNKSNLFDHYIIIYSKSNFKIILYLYSFDKYNCEDFIKNFNNYMKFTDENNMRFYDFFKNLMINHNKFINKSDNHYDETIELKKIIFDQCTNYMNHKLINQPVNIKNNLYTYQKANINWMLEREKHGKNIIIPNFPIININHKYDYNIIKNVFEKKDTSIKNILINGGCLSDDVGLGKTIQIITLCLLNPIKTLILTPTHLVKHWFNEFQKHTSNFNNFGIDNVDKLITICDFNNINITNNIKWDRIIIDEYHEIFNYNNNIITNIQKLNAKFNWAITATPFVSKNILHSLLRIIGNINVWNNNLSKYKLYLHQYAEIFRRNTKESIKQEINMPHITNHKYYLNFSKNEEKFYNSIKNNYNFSEERKYELLRQFCINPNISNRILDDNDIDNEEFLTLDEFKPKLINYFQKKINLIQPTIDVYQTKLKDNITEIDNYRSQKKLLKNKLIEEEETLKKKIKSNSENDKKKIKFDIKKNQYLINDIKYNILLIENKIYEIKPIINDINYDLEILNKEKTNYLNSINQINHAEEIIKKSINNCDSDEENEKCCVCLTDFSDVDEFTVLSCGHIYCMDCFKTIQYYGRGVAGKCQQCQTSLNNVKIINISNKKDNLYFSNNEFIKLINKYGTKLALIINLILNKNDIFDKKTIIYSSWNNCLNFMNKIFNENNIKTILPNENNLTEEIIKFEKDNNSKVLLLSSECNASGLNITSAKNVILLNPIKGTYSYRKQITNQIIGRIHRIGQHSDVNFIEIIIKDTIENNIDSENKIADALLEANLNKEMILNMTKNEHTF